MRVCVTTDQRLERTPDGAIWAPGAAPYSFWQRYLDVFEQVCVIARIRDTAEADAKWKRADGHGVSFARVPYFVGPLQYASRAGSIRRAVGGAVGRTDAVVMRASSPIATSLRALLRSGRPYGLEVVGDPYDVFAPGSTTHPLRPFFRQWFSAHLRRQCRQACAVAYVTKSTLQRRYPAAPNAFATHYSGVELPPEAFAVAPRLHSPAMQAVRLVGVGSLEQPYKGFDVLIDAVALCLKEGLGVELTLIGDGRVRAELEQRVATHAIGPKVRFTGTLPCGEPVINELERAHIFVLPSKTEGLPRAMIEAMARALPCIGTEVGGIPELLSGADMVPSGDAQALARKIRDVVRDPARLDRMSARNLENAREYCDSSLRVRRRQFLDAVRRATEEWLSDTTQSDALSQCASYK